MTNVRLRIRILLPALLAASLVTGLTGCHAFDNFDQSVEEPVPLCLEPPREKSLVTLPSYRIAPPDLLQIEMIKQVPLPPYRIEPYDTLLISVLRTLFEQPINNYFVVQGEGTVNLGPAYGSVRVAGMTVEEIRETIDKHLRQILAHPEVSVQLARMSGLQPIAAEYLVAPDGTVNLRQYGTVHVAGKTVGEAKLAVEQRLAEYFDTPEVSLNVIGFNSKVYYIITEGANLGDNVVRVPITGKERVLDALSLVQGLSPVSSEEIWIARPAPSGFGCEQILPVDYQAVTRGGSAATNYQLMPGDRVYIAENRMVALGNTVEIVTRPFQQALGFTSLINSSILNMQALGRSYNRAFRR